MYALESSDKCEIFVFNGYMQVLKDHTYQYYDWSFYLSWLGVAMCLAATTLFIIASSCLRRERAREQAQNIQYIMPGDWETRTEI